MQKNYYISWSSSFWENLPPARGGNFSQRLYSQKISIFLHMRGKKRGVLSGYRYEQSPISDINDTNVEEFDNNAISDSIEIITVQVSYNSIVDVTFFRCA